MDRERFVVSDTVWEKIEALLPGKKSDRGVTAKDNRLFLEAVLWRNALIPSLHSQGEAHFYSGPPMYFLSGVDSASGCRSVNPVRQANFHALALP